MTEKDLSQIESKLKITLPQAYRDLMLGRASELKDAGCFNDDLSTFYLDPEKIISVNKLNRPKDSGTGYAFPKWWQTCFLVGTNGGGDYYCLRLDNKPGVWMIGSDCGGKPTRVDHTDVPTAVFSEPELGTVGLTQAQACARLPKVDIYQTSFRPLKATLSGRDTRMFMKLVVDGTTDRVVGCHIIGADAGEMIQLLGIAVKMKATKADFDAVMAVHPTAAEELVILRQKATSYERQAAE